MNLRDGLWIPRPSRGSTEGHSHRRRAGDDAARESAETGERALVYVAATRAKKELLVLSYGRRSEFLDKDDYAGDLFGSA